MKKYRDHYFLKAKAENYPARSVYKLKELDERFHLLRPGIKILDLGAAPGSWSLGAAEKIGAHGRVLACDLKPVSIRLPPQVVFLKTDVLVPSDEFKACLAKLYPFDLVMSDMAPNTTGSRVTDHARSLSLAREAFNLARNYLKTSGNFVVKIFMGPDLEDLLGPMRNAFAQVKAFKPKSSRGESRETFFAATGFLGKQPAEAE